MTAAALFRRPPAPDPTAGSDRDLLRQFADGRDDAFAALVHRYGRLVFATCLRVLGHRADAEDAYQACFLVLARRAGSVRADEKLAGWLHTVAVRTATEVRRMRARANTAPSLTLPAPKDTPRDTAEQSELAAVLDEELAKLPDHYRLAVVLCELNGIGRKAAAKELGVAEGTLSSRLAKARKLLAERLTSRGFAGVSAGAMTAALASSAVAKIPATGLDFIHDFSTISFTVQSVAETVVKAMYATKLKTGAVLAVLLALTGGAVWTTAAGAGQPPGSGPAPAKANEDVPGPAALVKLLGSKDFAEREAAEKALREMGAKALPTVQDGARSENPEVAARCRKIVGAIRKDAREAFAAAFMADKDRSKSFDHPVWMRYVELVGDSPASRAVFTELLKYKYPDGLETLDTADRDPAKADELYRDHLCGIAMQVEPLLKYRFGIADMLPGHTADIAAYTLLLGSYRTDATPPEKLKGEESYRYTNGRNYILAFGDGLKEGFAGKLVVQGKDTKVGKFDRVAEAGPPGTDKVFARLVAAFNAADPVQDIWPASADPFAQHEGSELQAVALPPALYPEALATARRVIEDRSRPALRRAKWVSILRRFGDRSDTARLASLFEDKAVLLLKPCPVQVREWAIGTALVLRDKNPAELGFDRFPKQLPDRTKGEGDWSPALFAVAEADTKTTAFIPADAKDKVLTAAIKWLDDEEKKDKDDPAERWVKLLGSKNFAERETAERLLRNHGAKAYEAVTAGLKSDNPEVVARCRRLLPGVRAAWLARPESEHLKRFLAITGDTAHAKELFREMVADYRHADILMEAKPGEWYVRFAERLLKDYVAGIAEAWEQKRQRVREQTGRNDIEPLGMVVSTRLPSRGAATLLYFVGTFAESAKAKPNVGEDERRHYAELVQYALTAHRKDLKVKDGPDAFPPEARKLFAAWLGNRADARTVRYGMDVARTHELAEVLPVARALLADESRSLLDRTPALHLVALLGTKDDLARVKPFLDQAAVFFHSPDYTDGGKPYPCLVQVRDVAHATVAKLLGAEPADLGYDFCVLYKARGKEAFKLDLYHGFTSDMNRATAHAAVRALLANAPVPKDAGRAKPKKLPPAAPLPDGLRAELAGPSVLCTAEMVGKLEARAAELAKTFPAAEDRARVYLHTARAVANGRLSEDAATVAALADKAIELSRDPDTRWRARSLIASTISVSAKPAAEKKQRQAETLLAGYVELLVQELPDAEPQWPAGPRRGDFGDTPDRQAEYEKARDEAEFTTALVFGRKVLVMQLRDLFKPDGADELRALAAKRLTAGEVTTLMARVFDEK